MEAQVIFVNPNTFEYQEYQSSDIGLIALSDLDTAFTASSDYIEYHVYDANKNLIYPTVPPSNFINYNVKEGDILFDPVASLQEIDLDQGVYFSQYSFYRERCGSNFQNKFFISEISSDRTELRLDSSEFEISSISGSVNDFISYREAQPYFVDFLLNFGSNKTIIANNIELEDEDEDSTILVKLYDPLPSEFDLKSQLWIVEELSDPQAYRIEFPEEIIDVNDFEYIKGPNYNIDIVQQVGEATETVSFSSLLSTPQTSSLQQLKSLLEEKGININVNYENFSEFVKFSSALTRLENFYYKAKVIENTQNDLDTYIYPISGSTTSSVSYSSSKASLKTTIDSTIEGFDGYEYFLYFNSGSSFSWPKSNTTPPYTLYPTGSDEVINWLGSANESLSTYGGTALSASNYDKNNLDRLYNTIPEYLVEDPQNQNYELFVDMIAQHFDNIWLYTKDITNRFNADNRLEYGISKDLVADAIKEFGVKLYQNNYSTEDLYAAFLGITPSGSIFPISNITGSSPQEGQEIVTTYISGSDEIIPLNDVNKRIYKKIYHNLPFLLKSKGTMKGLKALISTFGVPSTILEPKEFGGRKKQEGVYDKPEEEFNYSLNLNGSSTYVETDWQLNSNWDSRNDVPASMIFRFKAQEVPSTYIPVATSQSLFRTDTGALLSLEYTGTAGTSGSYSGSIVDPEYQYGNLRFYPSGSDGVSTSISLPFFDGGWWSVMIQYDTVKYDTFNIFASNKSSNDQLTQQVKFSSNSSVESEYNYWSGSSTAYFGSEIGTREYFSGSLQEIRYYNVKISESIFNDYVLNPNSTEGNSTNSSPNELAFRASLGGELFTASFSIHPKVSGSGATTSSFENGSGYTVYNGTYVNNVEIISKNQVAAGIKTNTADKIQVVSSQIAAGSTLSPYRTVQQAQNLTTKDPDVRYVEIALSPQDQINKDIISQIGYFNIGEYIGDVREMDKDGTNYPALDRLRDSYFEKYIKSYDLVDFVRLIKFYDNSLFKMVKDFVPSNASLSSGVVIKQHLLERNRRKRILPTRENVTYSGSTDAVNGFGGGTGGSLDRYQTSGSQFQLTQSWSEVVQTLNGPTTKIINDEREFYTGEFPNQFGSGSSLIQVGTQDSYGVDCSEFSNPKFSDIYIIVPVFLNQFQFTEEEFVKDTASPEQGVVWLWSDGTGVQYVKISNISLNNIDITSFLKNLTELNLNLINPIKENGSAAPDGVYTWILENAVQKSNFTSYKVIGYRPENIIDANNSTKRNITFEATGDMIWHASASGDPVEPILADSYTSSYAQGYFPPANSNYPINQFFRGWADAKYFYDYNDLINTTGTIVPTNAVGFNKGFVENSTSILANQNTLQGISQHPWFMKAIAGIKKQINFIDLDDPDPRQIKLAAIQIRLISTNNDYDSSCENLDNTTVDSESKTIALLYNENKDTFSIDGGKLRLKEGPPNPNQYDTPRSDILIGKTKLFSFPNGNPYVWADKSLFKNGTMATQLPEGDYAIHENSIVNKDKAILQSSGENGMIEFIRWCPGEEAVGEEFATWYIRIGDEDFAQYDIDTKYPENSDINNDYFKRRKGIYVAPNSENIPQYKTQGGGAGFIKYYKLVEATDGSDDVQTGGFYRYSEKIQNYNALGELGWNTNDRPDQGRYVEVEAYHYQITQTQETNVYFRQGEEFGEVINDTITQEEEINDLVVPTRFGVLPVQGEVFRNNDFRYEMELYLMQFIPRRIIESFGQGITLQFKLYMVGGSRQTILKGDYEFKITYYNDSDEATIMYNDTYTHEFGPNEIRTDTDMPKFYPETNSPRKYFTNTIDSENGRIVSVDQTLEYEFIGVDNNGSPISPYSPNSSPRSQTIAELTLESGIVSQEQLNNLLGGSNSGFAGNDRFKVEILGFTPA